MDDLNEALFVAITAHADQKDKNGDPYILHPLRVMLDPRLTTVEQRILAVLHDVVEDTVFCLEDLSDTFSAKILSALDAITKRKGESLAKYCARVKADSLALSVKHCDVSDNSNPARLARLDNETALRLAEKYRQTIEMLK